MFKFLKKLWKDRRGNALAIAAAALPLVVGAAGLATDTIQWTLWKRQLQRAADSAAFAGVYDRAAASGATTNTSSAVCRDLNVNLHTWMPLVATWPCVGSSVGSYSVLTYPANTAYVTNQVQVTLRVQQALPFSSLFMSAAPVITATATAGSVTAGGSPCALALSPTGQAIDNSGNTIVNAPNCILYSDSAASNAAAAGGSSAITAKAIAGVGGIASSNNWNVQQYLPYSPSLPDPLAPPSTTAVTPDPADMKCAGHYETQGGNGGSNNSGNGSGSTQVWVYDDLTDSTDMASATYLDSSGNVQTGANCWKSMSVGSNRSLTVPNNLGPLYINGGNVNLQGAFSCTGCAIVLTNKDPSNTATIGTFDSNAQATNNITAPTSGTYNGIAVYQDRRAPGGNVDRINGGSGNVLSGAVYFPNDNLWLNGTGDAVSLCSMFISRNLIFNGGGRIAMSAPTDTACLGVHMPVGSGITVVRLVA
jgi:Flp pilus assembly protein TadG